MKRTAILAAAALALSACTTTQTAQIDTAIQSNLPKACSALESGYTAFVVIAATGKIKASTVAKVDAAYQGVRPICRDPANTTAVDALIRAAQAYVIVSTALKQAE